MPERSSGKLNLPLMILAFLSVIAFVYWLSAVSEPTELALAQEEELDPPLELGLTTFQGRVDDVMGERVRLMEVQVATRVSPESFFFAFPDGTPYLVRLLPRVIEEGVLVVEGDVLEVTGRIHAMSDSVLNHWETLGILRDATARSMAEFATTFLEADGIEVRVPAGGDPMGGEGDDDGGDGTSS